MLNEIRAELRRASATRRLDGDPECLNRSEGRRRAGRPGRSHGRHLGADDRTDLGTYSGQRNLVAENGSLRSGGWQQSVGEDMAGRTLSVLGLGNVGRAVAQIGNAFGMKVIAWSQNLTTERAAKVGATLVSKDKLFQEADIVTVYLVLSGRTRGLVGVAELPRWQRDPRLRNRLEGCRADRYP
jgi:hypothetical protein